MKTFCAILCLVSAGLVIAHSINTGDTYMLTGFTVGALVFGISSPIILFLKD